MVVSELSNMDIADKIEKTTPHIDIECCFPMNFILSGCCHCHSEAQTTVEPALWFSAYMHNSRR